MRKRLILLLVMSCLILGAVGLYLVWPSPITTLPEPSRVRRMEAYVGNSWRQLPNTPRFEVPQEHIQKIMAALSGFPRDLDAERRSRIGLGLLWIHCDDGRTVQVGLYHSHGRGVCIYCVGGTHYKCYSGGNDREVDDAIRAAYAGTADALQGRWLGVSYEENGDKPVTDIDMKFGVTGDKYIVKVKQKQVAEGTIKLDPAKRQFEMSDEKWGQQRAIYKLEGETLTICYAPASEGRPTEFKTRVGTTQRLIILKGETPTEP